VYNKSGIEIMQTGMQWVQETVHLQGVPIAVNHMDGSRGKVLVAKYKIITTRFRNSKYSRKFTSSKSGLLKGDVIISINKNPAYKYSLQKINLFLRPESEKWITIEVERKGKLLKFRFQLIDILKN
jgi:C-terminal processing protease CtpA/Prc